MVPRDGPLFFSLVNFFIFFVFFFNFFTCFSFFSFVFPLFIFYSFIFVLFSSFKNFFLFLFVSLFSFLGCPKSVAVLQDSLGKSAHSELALFALHWLVVTFPCGIVHILVMIRLRVVHGGRRVGQVLPSYQNRQMSALDETADAPQSSLFSLLLSSSLFHLSFISFIFSSFFLCASMWRVLFSVVCLVCLVCCVSLCCWLWLKSFELIWARQLCGRLRESVGLACSDQTRRTPTTQPSRTLSVVRSSKLVIWPQSQPIGGLFCPASSFTKKKCDGASRWTRCPLPPPSVFRIVQAENGNNALLKSLHLMTWKKTCRLIFHASSAPEPFPRQACFVVLMYS